MLARHLTGGQVAAVGDTCQVGRRLLIHAITHQRIGYILIVETRHHDLLYAR
jgi:hypothetical protein